MKDDLMLRVQGHVTDAMALLWGAGFIADESTSETPRRVAKAWAEMTNGLAQDPLEPLKRTFACDHDEIVLIKDIPFKSLCEHHLLPFMGVASVAYIPSGRVVGLSKIPRCINILAARPQIQERLTEQLADAIAEALNPRGVAVVMSAEHTCMTVRGVQAPGSKTVTSAMRGVFREDSKARMELMQLIR
jgi:GTP cyclohydrolase I